MTKQQAIVTGAARGIGLACARALAADGMQVHLCDVDGDEAKSAAAALGNDAEGHTCDMTDPDRITALFDKIEAHHGPVSVLVNNAGIALPGDFLNYSSEDFDQVIAVNLKGTFLATQHIANAMIRNGVEGAIVNMSSVNAQISIPTIAAYCASKGGVMQLTKASALALAPHGIRVNAVGPGSIDTAMMAGVNADPDAMSMVMSRTPLKRIGEPREIGDVVAFLASDKASYITGETIYVDGGRLGLNYTC